MVSVLNFLTAHTFVDGLYLAMQAASLPKTKKSYTYPVVDNEVSPGQHIPFVLVPIPNISVLIDVTK